MKRSRKRVVAMAASMLAVTSAFALAACDDAVLGARREPCGASGCADASGGGNDGCPEVEAPACDDGEPIAEHDGACVTGYVCAAVCTTASGTCATLAACSGGRWANEGWDCGLTPGLGCCRPCPQIAAPPADFCDGGPIEQVLEGECLVDFVCG